MATLSGNHIETDQNPKTITSQYGHKRHSRKSKSFLAKAWQSKLANTGKKKKKKNWRKQTQEQNNIKPCCHSTEKRYAVNSRIEKTSQKEIVLRFQAGWINMHQRDGDECVSDAAAAPRCTTRPASARRRWRRWRKVWMRKEGRSLKIDGV